MISNVVNHNYQTFEGLNLQSGQRTPCRKRMLAQQSPYVFENIPKNDVAVIIYIYFEYEVWLPAKIYYCFERNFFELEGAASLDVSSERHKCEEGFELKADEPAITLNNLC